MLQVTSLDNSVDVKCASLNLRFIDLLVKDKGVEKGIVQLLVRHHEREKPRILSLYFNSHHLRKDEGQVFVGLLSGAVHMEQHLRLQIVLLILVPNMLHESFRMQPRHKKIRY